jgi:polyisoprenoid-binding protein YceI
VKLCLRSLVVLSIVGFITLSAQAEVKSVGSSTASFDVAGPGGLNIHGKTSELSASEAKGKVKVTVVLANLTTGISLRDSHMRDRYLEVDKYPNASVVVSRSKLDFPAKGRKASGSVAGQMTLHGVTKPVTLDYSAKSRGDKLDVRGSTHIDMRDYGITVPKYLGVGVDSHVTINVDFKVVDR